MQPAAKTNKTRDNGEVGKYGDSGSGDQRYSTSLTVPSRNGADVFPSHTRTRISERGIVVPDYSDVDEAVSDTDTIPKSDEAKGTVSGMIFSGGIVGAGIGGAVFLAYHTLRGTFDYSDTMTEACYRHTGCRPATEADRLQAKIGVYAILILGICFCLAMTILFSIQFSQSYKRFSRGQQEEQARLLGAPPRRRYDV